MLIRVCINSSCRRCRWWDTFRLRDNYIGGCLLSLVLLRFWHCVA